MKVSIAGSLRDREVACSASDRQGSNFESCVWMTVSSQSSHHPQEVLLAQFSPYVHKGGLKPDSFHFIFSRHVACITKLWNKTIMMNKQRLPLKVLKYMRNNNLGWVKRVKSIFLELDLDITSNDILHILLQTVKEHLVKKDTHQWKLSVASEPKLRTYALFKINLKTELYVSLLIPKCKRSIFCQFRSGILPLATETGRYRNVPADERLCEICNLNLVEDEIHFLCF